MPSPDTYKSIGMALPASDSSLPGLAENGTRVFGDGVCLMAEALGKQLDDVICVPSFALATRDVDCGWMQIPEGHVAGVEVAWRGMEGSRCVVQQVGRWVMDEPVEPAWEILHGWHCFVEGYPGIKTSVEVNPSSETARELGSMPGLVALAMSVTAMPVINAIPAVCAAAPGIRTYLDLPIITGRLD
ncbi:MAG: hypothetical protein U5K56_04420 [Halioglobus sp.]|nr:hypothetical protein [Halioglobus sp.]